MFTWYCYNSITIVAGHVPSPVTAQFTCPVVADICSSGRYPDDRSCAHYYECSPALISGCNQVHYQCPPGSVFDWELRVCADPDVAQCAGKITNT